MIEVINTRNRIDLIEFTTVTDNAVFLGDDDAGANPALIHRSVPPLERLWPTHIEASSSARS